MRPRSRTLLGRSWGEAHTHEVSDLSRAVRYGWPGASTTNVALWAGVTSATLV
ncbi:hypothetical protein J6590_062883 [Homalodisca vitripennis]|nr:hypothetical protein J6590_062883 [Homalodisca vitripennis]